MDGLHLALYQLISAMTGVEPVIWQHQNAPRPNLPYWTMRLSSMRKLGWDAYSQGVDLNGDQIVSGVREATLQIQRFGDGSDIAVSNLRDSLSKITVQEGWQVAKISVFNTGDVLDVVYKLDNEHYEPRANVDLFIRFGTELLDNVGIIETVVTDAGYITNQSVGFDELNPDLGQVISVVL
jgi:hypothetical protein